MELGNSCKSFERATGILGQLLKYTKQIASCEDDSHVDIPALSEACARRMAALQEVMPLVLEEIAPGQQEAGNLAGLAKVADMMRELRDQTLLCTEILDRGKDKVSCELESLSRVKRAVRAYKS